jgi:hypothetical protein
MKKGLRILTAAALCVLGAGMAAQASPVGTAITYQGRLKLSGALVNGTADLQFRLFDAQTGGSQIGSTINQNSVDIQEGLFTRSLDFGVSAFNGEARWLEVAVRSPAGTGNFVILTPRQTMSAAPYARYAVKPWDTNGSAISYTAGRVGIGPSASPTSLLDLNGSQDALKIRGGEPFMTLVDTSSANIRVQLQNSGGRFFITPESFINGTNTGSFTMVDTEGRMGIGTFSPTSRVEIAAQDGLAITGFQPFMTLRDTGAGGARAVISTGNGDIGFYSNGALARQFPSVLIKDNDWVGMGVVPGFRLDLPNIGNNDGRARANRWDTYSSIRWKDNVQTIENAIDKVMQLRGVTFDWKAEHGGTHDVGFVAEEVGKVLPELVSWEEDGEWAKGLAYDHITAVTVEAIKEQQAQIDGLKKANAELREQVEKLAQKLEKKSAK